MSLFSPTIFSDYDPTLTGNAVIASTGIGVAAITQYQTDVEVAREWGRVERTKLGLN